MVSLTVTSSLNKRISFTVYVYIYLIAATFFMGIRTNASKLKMGVMLLNGRIMIKEWKLLTNIFKIGFVGERN